MTFRTFSAAKNYLKNIGKAGYIETRNYSGNGYNFTEYTVILY